MSKYEKIRLALVVIQISMTLAAPWIFMHITNQTNFNQTKCITK